MPPMQIVSKRDISDDRAHRRHRRAARSAGRLVPQRRGLARAARGVRGVAPERMPRLRAPSSARGTTCRCCPGSRLRGRCRDCRAPISVRYPLVEAGTAVLFVARGGLRVDRGPCRRSPISPRSASRWPSSTSTPTACPNAHRPALVPGPGAPARGRERRDGGLGRARARRRRRRGPVDGLLRDVPGLPAAGWASATSSSPACSAWTWAGSAGDRSRSAPSPPSCSAGSFSVGLLVTRRATRGSRHPVRPVDDRRRRGRRRRRRARSGTPTSPCWSDCSLPA